MTNPACIPPSLTPEGNTQQLSKPELHPWLSTPEALDAARKATQIPLSLLPRLAAIVGTDELASEALAILTECALPPREPLRAVCAKCGGSLAGVRAGAKFCSQRCRTHHAKNVQRGKTEVLPSGTHAHIGSMHAWPEAERSKYAIRTVGYALNNYLRTRQHARETPASETLANLNVPVAEPEETPREIVEAYLDSKGIKYTGEESFEELCEAAMSARGLAVMEALEPAA